MGHDPDSTIVVTISGLLRGVDLTGEGTVVVRGGALELVLGRRRLTLPVAALHGVRARAGAAELFLDTGDVVELRGAAAEGVAALVARCGCELPEVTRSLRALGSQRARADATHERFFAPLLAARQLAEAAGEAPSRIRALDAAALRQAMTRLLGEMARELHPREPAEQRALEAELLDHAEGVFARLAELERAQRAVTQSDDAVRLAHWRAWTDALCRVFASADACWLAVAPLLQGARPPRASAWRRWMRLGALLAATVVPGSLPRALRAQHVTLRVTGAPADSLRARGFDVVGAGPGFTIVVADSADRARLAALAWAAMPLETPAARARALGAVERAAPAVYRPFDDTGRGVAFFLDSLARANPLVHLDTIGASVEGRPILAVKVGDADDSPARPNVLFLATYHAREWAATETALRLVRYLAQQPAASARADSLVRRRDVWVIPVVNPDGYQFTFAGDRLWRKNRRRNADGSVGVDLNRNHAEQWGRDNRGSSPLPVSEVYRGPVPESEPETQAVVAFHRAHPPVASVSYHTYAGLLLYPYGYADGLLPDDWGVFRALAGTDARPAVVDHLAGSPRDHYHPGPGWTLYVTNGEYTDWAYAAHGALAFTPELTSGWEGGQYYGFEFPDDEVRLRTLFTDNLPFALDVLDAAAAPLGARPQASGVASERITLESVSPTVRVRVPVEDAARTTVREPAAVPLAPDPAATVARYTRRLVSPTVPRPPQLTLDVAGETLRYDVLAATGAERGDAPWAQSGFTRSALRVAGDSAWAGGTGMLRSPPITVPPDADQVHVLFWTRYDGDPFDLAPHGEVRVSSDGGRTWTLAGVVAGQAQVFYPERADIAGAAGQTIVVEFNAQFALSSPRWWLDEITVVAPRGSGAVERPVARARGLEPSENPARGSTVYFAWPFGVAGGEAAVYDVAGRPVWRARVPGNARSVTWDIAASQAANGVYLVVLRAGGSAVRGKLYVIRSGS